MLWANLLVHRSALLALTPLATGDRSAYRRAEDIADQELEDLLDDAFDDVRGRCG